MEEGGRGGEWGELEEKGGEVRRRSGEDKEDYEEKEKVEERL